MAHHRKRFAVIERPKYAIPTASHAVWVDRHWETVDSKNGSTEWKVAHVWIIIMIILLIIIKCNKRFIAAALAHLLCTSTGNSKCQPTNLATHQQPSDLRTPGTNPDYLRIFWGWLTLGSHNPSNHIHMRTRRLSGAHVSRSQMPHITVLKFCSGFCRSTILREYRVDYQLFVRDFRYHFVIRFVIFHASIVAPNIIRIGLNRKRLMC